MTEIGFGAGFGMPSQPPAQPEIGFGSSVAQGFGAENEGAEQIGFSGIEQPTSTTSQATGETGFSQVPEPTEEETSLPQFGFEQNSAQSSAPQFGFGAENSKPAFGFGNPGASTVTGTEEKPFSQPPNNQFGGFGNQKPPAPVQNQFGAQGQEPLSGFNINPSNEDTKPSFGFSEPNKQPSGFGTAETTADPENADEKPATNPIPAFQSTEANTKPQFNLDGLSAKTDDTKPSFPSLSIPTDEKSETTPVKNEKSVAPPRSLEFESVSGAQPQFGKPSSQPAQEKTSPQIGAFTKPSFGGFGQPVKPTNSVQEQPATLLTQVHMPPDEPELPTETKKPAAKEDPVQTSVHVHIEIPEFVAPNNISSSSSGSFSSSSSHNKRHHSRRSAIDELSEMRITNLLNSVAAPSNNQDYAKLAAEFAEMRSELNVMQGQLEEMCCDRGSNILSDQLHDLTAQNKEHGFEQFALIALSILCACMALKNILSK